MSVREQKLSDMQTPFERTLLLSARADALPPEATEQAWLRFSGVMGAATLSAGAAHAGAVATSTGWAQLVRLGALKYLLLGALGGSALTVTWFRAHPVRVREATPAALLAASVAASSAAAAVAPPTASEAAIAPPASTLTLKHKISSNSAPFSQQKSPAAATAEARTSEPDSAPPSTLSAETAALDAARNASAAGAFQRALRLLQQFQQDFPHSVLRADAQAATIQTLEAAGEHAQATRQAMQFLAEYPNAPHSMTLKRLLR